MLGEISYLCPQEKMEGTFLTREQVEEISTRISKSALEIVSKQLEQVISSNSSDNKKQTL